MDTRRIALIGTDPELHGFLQTQLAAVSYSLFPCPPNKDTVLQFLLDSSSSLVLIDISRAGLEGIDICNKIRSSTSLANIPVILIAANGQDDMIAQWLNAGANGYIDKPISPQILIAQIQSIMRMSEKHAHVLSFQGLALDLDCHSVKLNGQEIDDLTKNEYRFLLLLLKHPNRVFSRDQIIRELQDGEHASTDRAVDVMLVYLRRKLGDWCNHVKTVRGFGYQLS